MKLSTIMAEVSGTSFVGIDTITTPVLTGGKKNPMKGKVRKIMKGASVMVFQNKNSSGYENMVKKRLVAEGKNPETFKVGPRPWGTRMANLPVVEHKGNEYLEVIFLQSGKVSYTLDGQPIEMDQIQGLPEGSNGEQGNLDNKVVIRTFAADSITAIRINGTSIEF